LCGRGSWQGNLVYLVLGYLAKEDKEATLLLRSTNYFKFNLISYRHCLIVGKARRADDDDE